MPNIAEVDEAIYLLTIGVIEHGIEGFDVVVEVGKNGDGHGKATQTFQHYARCTLSNNWKIDKPWLGAQAIADGSAILTYVKETATDWALLAALQQCVISSVLPATTA